jgi:phosphoribosylanthranilate isomerase
MREMENIDALQQLDMDFMGLIRYPQSRRFLDEGAKKALSGYQFNKGTVGVYVNAELDHILADLIPLQLDLVQLHGDEDPAFAKALLELDIKVIKAIQISEDFDFRTLLEWEQIGMEYQGKFFFLFDTASADYGGSGRRFDWKLLDNYLGKVPFLLSGGINETHAKEIKEFKHEMFLGIDINSGFEIEAGIKDIEKIEKFIKKFGR